MPIGSFENAGAQNRISSTFGFVQRAHAQRTMPASLSEQFADRLEVESAVNVPRSRRAWSAEESRLGSWGTGVGRYRQSGTGQAYTSGTGVPRIQQDRR